METQVLEIERIGIEPKVVSLAEQVKSVEIVNNEQYVGAAEWLKSIALMRREIDSTFDPIITAAHAAHKEAITQKAKIATPLVEAERLLKGRMGAYQVAQEQIRRAEEARLREEARRAEEDRRLAEALEAERNGAHEDAEEIISQPTVVPVVILQRSTPTVQGISSRKTWSFRVVNPALVPREYLKLDDVKIGGYVRAMKEQANITGIEVYSTDSVAVRTR